MITPPPPDHFRRIRKNGYYRLGRQPLWLFAPHGDGERFARLWDETWRRLPLAVRRAIRRHWRSPKAIGYGVIQSPLIELLDDWVVREEGGLGAVFRGGHQVRFAAEAVDAAPDDVVQDLIAHELAHVHQWAVGEMELLLADSEDPDFNYSEIELWADERVLEWGFSVTSIDEWSLATGRTTIRDFDAMTALEREEWEARWRRAGR